MLKKHQREMMQYSPIVSNKPMPDYLEDCHIQLITR